MMVAGRRHVEVQTELMTFAEFERLPDPPSGHLELHHGEVVHVPPRIPSHFDIQGKLLLLLRELESAGRLSDEFPFHAASGYEYWTADIGFISKARWLANTGKYFMGAPDMVIEILSESNTMNEMQDRQDVCLDNGCVCFSSIPGAKPSR
jgi:Uma2 family endonuclease